MDNQDQDRPPNPAGNRGPAIAEAPAPSHAPQVEEALLVLTPDLVILDASEAYRRSTLLWNEAIHGCGLFEVFPDNPEDPLADGARNLRASLEQVLRDAAAHRMKLQRYDVPDRVAGDGQWVEKHWLPRNTPVFGSGSSEITHVIHEVEDVTEAVRVRRWLADRDERLGEQMLAIESMRSDLQRRRRELRAAAAVLDETLRNGAVAGGTSGAIPNAAASARRRYSAAGERADVSGIYRAYHRHACSPAPGRVMVRAGWRFPRCTECSERVLYRLVRPLR